MPPSLRHWILATRPKTLTAAFVPVLAGTALAWSDSGGVRWAYALLALLGALLIQIATNLVNDAKDFEKGTDDGARVGPARVTASGLIEQSSVMRVAWVAFALAALAGVPLLIRGGWPLLVIGLASILAGYLYTAGPYPLAYHGLGEPFVILFFGLVAVGGTYYLQLLEYRPGAFVAGLAVGMLSCVLLAVNNLRDLTGDARSGKRTLAVKFGREFAHTEIACFAWIPLGLGVWWWSRGEVLAAVAPLLLAPLAASITQSAGRDTGSALNQTLGRAAAMHALFGLLFSLGVVLG